MEILGLWKRLRSSANPIAGRLLALAVFTVLASPAASPAAPAPVATRSQLEAVFLYNFAEFVTWPPSAFANDDNPIVIGVLGEDPFGTFLDDAVRGERINNRPVVIRRYSRVGEIEACHILFISRSESGQLGSILKDLKNRSILTVGDSDDFNKEGGMIRFAVENSKVRLKINLQAAREAHLTISSKLLRPAEVVSMRGY